MLVLKSKNLEKSEWMACLPSCLMGLRFCQHKVLGLAPYTLCYGLAPAIPLPVGFVEEPFSIYTDADVYKSAWDLGEHI